MTFEPVQTRNNCVRGGGEPGNEGSKKAHLQYLCTCTCPLVYVLRFSSENHKSVLYVYTQTAVDTLMMKFTTTIHDQAYAVVAGYVKVNTT